MPNPIFGPNSQGKYQGAFRTTVGTVLSFAGADLNLIQNLQVSHQQPVTPLFEVGTNNRYYVVGKASGTFSATQILGFGDAALKQVTNLADPCSPRQLVLAIPSAFCEAWTLPKSCINCFPTLIVVVSAKSKIVFQKSFICY